MSYYSEAEKLYEQEMYEEAYELYKKGAEKGEVKCYFGIAITCHIVGVEFNGKTCDDIFDEYIPQISTLARAGDLEASQIMYYYYSEGLCGYRSNKKIFEWLKICADQGWTWAQSNVASLYLYGGCIEGCTYKTNNGSCYSTECIHYQKPNLQEAFKYFSLAAEDGDSYSQFF